jgi:cytochrome c-type biogenesis protein CcmH
MMMWILFAAMLVIALLFVLLPLLRTPRAHGPEQNAHNVELLRKRLVELEGDLANGALNETQFALAREDLERELLQELTDTGGAVRVNASPKAGRLSAAIMVIALPALALGLYYNLGSWRMLDNATTSAMRQSMPTESAVNNSTPNVAADGSTPANDGMAPVDELVTRLEQKLKDDPSNAKGWLMLGRSYVYLNRPADAVRAYAQAETLTTPPEAQLYAEYAEALALANGDRLTGAPERLIEKALTLQPDNPNALWLAGMNAFQKADYPAAVKYWESLQKITAADNEQGRMLADYLAQARAENPVEAIVQPNTPPNTGANATAAPTVASSGTSMKVHVALDPALAAKASPDDTVFIFARASQGPPMPLAIVRLQVKDLPAEVTLDDTQAMMPAMKLSNYAEVVVGARVSKRGDAMPASGDLQVLSDALQTQSTAAVSLTIDQVIP